VTVTYGNVTVHVVGTNGSTGTSVSTTEDMRLQGYKYDTGEEVPIGISSVFFDSTIDTSNWTAVVTTPTITDAFFKVYYYSS
jgi:hypothetical protein